MTENFDINKHGRVIFEVNEAPQPTDLELRIRREVMADLDKMIACEADDEEYHKSILLRIKDRLNLLWGSNE